MIPNANKAICFTGALALAPLLFGQTPPPGSDGILVPLAVSAGRPLRLYITKRVRYREGDPVEAKFAEPVWAFDRIVIPFGTSVQGRLIRLQPVPGLERTMAIVRGDFTPLKTAQVVFTEVVLPDGRRLPIDSQPSLGQATIYVPPRSGKSAKPIQAPKGGKIKAVKQQLQAQISGQTLGLIDFVRGPNKREWLESFLWSKLPYHPQWYRAGTRFDAVLNKPIDLGSVTIAEAKLKDVGTQPLLDSTALIRMTSTVTSHDAHMGDPIEGTLSQPLFSGDGHLLLPEGTRAAGKVTLTRPARMFHRGGRLRFAFDDIQPPATATLRPPLRVQAQLDGAEQQAAGVSIDKEGMAQATESKTRFLRPVIAGLVAARTMDNDEGRQGASGGADSNLSGRALGGFSGFGLFGTALSRIPQPAGQVFGFYGLAWSAYSSIVSRGKEVIFTKNAEISIRFGASRSPGHPPNKP